MTVTTCVFVEFATANWQSNHVALFVSHYPRVLVLVPSPGAERLKTVDELTGLETKAKFISQ